MNLTWALAIGGAFVLLLLAISLLVGFILGIKWTHAHFQSNHTHRSVTDKARRQLFFF